MVQNVLLTVAGLSFLTGFAFLVAWLRNERRDRRAFINTVSEDARRRLNVAEAVIDRGKSRKMENAAKIDQRMAELEVLISDPNSQREARKAG